MEIETYDLIQKNIRLIDVLRMHKKLDKTSLAQIMNVTWPTISSYVNSLIATKILTKEGNLLSINKSYGILFGISVGSAQIKICALDMMLQPLNKDNFQSLIQGDDIFATQKKYMKEHNTTIEYYLYSETPPNEKDLILTLNEIFNSIKKIIETQSINVLSIGICFTGAVDKKRKRIIKASNLPFLNNLNFEEGILLRNYLDFFETRDINIAIENNSIAAGIAEKWSLYNNETIKGEYNINNKYKDKKNIVSIYLGAGLGLSVIQNNHIHYQNDSHSQMDGIGHLEVPNFSENENVFQDKCPCGRDTCLDYRIRHDVFEQTFEEFKTKTSADINDFFKDKTDKQLLMGKYIGYLVNIINSLLNPDIIIITGKLHLAIDHLWGAIQQKRNESYYNDSEKNCLLIKSNLGAIAPAIGAAISGYYDKFKSDIEW